MFSPKHFRFSSLAVLALASLAFVGCGKDKSLDEYQAQQANEEFAKLQKNAGSFGGAATTQAGNQSVTTGVVISLFASLDPVQNGNNSGQNSRANLRGNVTIYNNGTQSSGVITTASFLKAPDQDDDTVGTINGQVSVQLTSSSGTTSTASFTLNGSKNGDQFNGVITPTDRAGVSANFTTTKGAPASRGQGSILPGAGRTIEYNGRDVDPSNRGSLIPYLMTVNSGTSSAGYDFVNLFADEKLYNVHLEIGGAVVPLPAVNYERDGSLVYHGTVTSNGIATQLDFSCTPAGQGYHCSYNNAQQAILYVFTVNPTSATNPRPVPNPGPAPIEHPPGSPIPNPVHRPHR